MRAARGEDVPGARGPHPPSQKKDALPRLPAQCSKARAHSHTHNRMGINHNSPATIPCTAALAGDAQGTGPAGATMTPRRLRSYHHPSLGLAIEHTAGEMKSRRKGKREVAERSDHVRAANMRLYTVNGSAKQQRGNGKARTATDSRRSRREGWR